MRTSLRWILGVLFILAVSIFLLILALPFLVNPNDYKKVLTDLVREKTGRELLISGDIHLQISPGLQVICTLDKVRLGGNAPFANSPFIEGEQAKLELSLWPLLLQRRVHMAGIMLDGVTLNLLRNKEGLNNWENLNNYPATANEAPDGGTQGITGTDSGKQQPSLTRFLPGLTGLDLGKVHLSHLNVRYDNRQTDRIVVLQDMKIKTGRVREKGQFPFEAGFNLILDQKGAGQPAIIRSADVVMQGNGTLFMQESRLLLEDLRLDGTIKGRNLPKRGLKLFFSTNSDIHLRQQKISLKAFSLTHEDVTLKGSGTLENLPSPRFDLSLKIPECSPKSILQVWKTPLDTDPSTRLSAEFLLTGDMELAEMSKLTIMVDETTVTGAITIKDLRDPAYEATLHANHLDLDRYAPPKTVTPPAINEQQAAFVAAEGEPADASPPIIPVTFLRSLPLQLDLRLDSLKVDGAELSQVELKFVGEEGILQLTPLTAHLYGGSMKLEARMDVTGEIPELQIKPRLEKVQLAQLFQDMTGREEVTGTALIEADLNTSGLSREEFRSHINGTLRFELLNGAIKPLTVMQTIRTTLAEHRKETAPPVATEGATEFVRLAGTGSLEDGIFYSDDLVAAAQSMQMSGAGEMDLARGQVDFLLNISLFPDPEHDADRALSEFGGRMIPYRVFGPFTDLKQQADVTKLIRTGPGKQFLDKTPEKTDSSPAQKKQQTKGD